MKDWPSRARLRVIAVLTIFAGLSGLAVLAHAAIASISPSSGETAPGGTVIAQVTVTVDNPLQTTCLTATVTPAATITVTFDNPCGGARTSTMTVDVGALTGPGTYLITVQELDLTGGTLSTRDWPLTVLPPPTTTTLLPTTTITLLDSTTTTLLDSTTTITLLDSTTTTLLDSTTTITLLDSTTTTLALPGSPTTDSEATTDSNSESTTTSTTGDAAGAGPSATIDLSTTQPSPDAGELPLSGETPLPPAFPALGGLPDPPFAELRVTSQLLDVLDRALPSLFTQALVSPLVILEVLLRSLGRTALGLVAPLGATVLLGVGLMWRLHFEAKTFDAEALDLQPVNEDEE